MYIKTPRLIIRNICSTDLDDYFEIGNDYKTAIAAGWVYHDSLETTANIIALSEYDDNDFAIILAKENKMIGTISLYEARGRSGVNALNLGFALSGKYRKNGYMTEAVYAVVEYAFRILQIEILCCAHDINNKESESVIKKFPFQFEGVQRKFRRLSNNDVIDCNTYSMLKEEFYVYQKSRNIGCRSTIWT